LPAESEMEKMTDRKNNKKTIVIDVDTAKISGICK
jgi:hypothetical protein